MRGVPPIPPQECVRGKRCTITRRKGAHRKTRRAEENGLSSTSTSTSKPFNHKYLLDHPPKGGLVFSFILEWESGRLRLVYYPV